VGPEPDASIFHADISGAGVSVPRQYEALADDLVKQAEAASSLLC